MKVFTVVGNRPQFIKAAPLSAALRDAGADEVVLHTGQHWFHVMSQVFFDQLGLAEPNYRLDLRTSDIAAMQPAIAARLVTTGRSRLISSATTNPMHSGTMDNT